MSLGEFVLNRISRDPKAPDYCAGTLKTNLGNALDYINKTLPDFSQRVANKRVLDFGCGWGWQSVAMLKQCNAAHVVGVDIVKEHVAKAQRLAEEHRCTGRMSVYQRLPSELAGTFDVVLSCGIFEHFGDPAAVLDEMRLAACPGGCVLITFFEPWLSPYGGHMSHFTRVPWINVFFSERTVMNVRSLFRSDGALRYEDIEGGLNRMTIAKFERILAHSGMHVEWLQYYPVKKLPAVARIPIIREFLVSAAACILRNELSAAYAPAGNDVEREPENPAVAN